MRMLFIQAAKVLPTRPQNWERFSFGAWLKQAAPHMHRNKLGEQAGPYQLERLEASAALRHPPSGASGDLIQSPNEFATEQRLERNGALNLAALMVGPRPVR